MAELQDLVMRLVGERNEWYTRYMSAVNNPDFMPIGGDVAPPAELNLELDAVDGPGIYIYIYIYIRFVHRRECTDVFEEK